MKYLTFAILAILTFAVTASAAEKPNFILVFCDDMAYADFECFGSKVNSTPNLNKMAKEGRKMTSFYSACSVCTPSRSALMTGCYPKRIDMHVDERGRCVLFADAKKGLNPKEVTIAEMLKEQGYQTACIGKWHMGDKAPFLPTKQGFDSYYGIPYSNDMTFSKSVPVAKNAEIREGLNRADVEAGNVKNKRCLVPIIKGEEIVIYPADQKTVTQKYTEQAVSFIKKAGDKPFFLYLPHSQPHWPQEARDEFVAKAKNKNKKYGGAIEEIDWSMGEIFKTLKEEGLDKNTFVLITSDNGGTSAGGPDCNAPLRGWKGKTLEGGMRVYCVVWMPGKVPADTTCDEVCGTIDVAPTFAKMAGGAMPDDRIIDGRDISDLFLGKKNAKSPHEYIYFYQMAQLQGIRSGKWKMYLPHEEFIANWGRPRRDTKVELYDLDADIGETKNLASENPDVVKTLTKACEKFDAELTKNQRKAGYVEE